MLVVETQKQLGNFSDTINHINIGNYCCKTYAVSSGNSFTNTLNDLGFQDFGVAP